MTIGFIMYPRSPVQTFNVGQGRHKVPFYDPRATSPLLVRRGSQYNQLMFSLE